MTKRESKQAQHKALLQEALNVVRAAESENRDLTAEELTTVSTKRAEAANVKTQLDATAGLEEEVTRAGVVTVHNRQQDEPFKNLGEQLIAVARSAKPGAGVDPRLLGIQERAALGASEAVPSDGGFLVQTDFSSELMKKAHEAGQLVSRVRHIPISANANGIKMNVIDESSRATGSRWGGVQLYWVAEAGTATAKKPKLRQLGMDLQKLMGLFYATDELLSDAGALGSIASQAFTEEFGFVFDDSVFRGSGVGQPLGFMNSPALVTITKETGQAADTIVTENIAKMYAAMPSSSKSSAVWLVNANVMPQLLTLSIGVGAAGQPVFMPPGGISGAPYGMIFGRPVVECEQSASIGDLGDIAFVDLSEYLWIEKGGVQAASSIHVQFLTDETTFRWVARVNGQPSWNLPLTPYKGVASSFSPFVTLAAR